MLCTQGQEVTSVAGGAEHTIAIVATGEVCGEVEGGPTPTCSTAPASLLPPEVCTPVGARSGGHCWLCS